MTLKRWSNAMGAVVAFTARPYYPHHPFISHRLRRALWTLITPPRLRNIPDRADRFQQKPAVSGRHGSKYSCRIQLYAQIFVSNI